MDKKPFAKLFETDEYGQILVVLDTGEECKPEVRFSFIPKNLGVCSLALKFEDSDQGWEQAEAAFNEVDREKAIDAVLPTIQRMDGIF